jgi:hypothetical protein
MASPPQPASGSFPDMQVKGHSAAVSVDALE